MKLKWIAALAAIAWCCVPARAQTQAPNVQGNIVASSSACATSFSCVWESVLPSNAATTTINISGTFSATLLVEESNNGGQTWSTAATLSSAGTTTYSTNGFTDIRVRCSAYVSGTAAVTISTGLNTGLQGPPGPGGSGGGITQVAPSVLSQPCTGNGVVTSNAAPFGIYSCINSIYQLDSPAGGVIYAATYGAKGLWQVESTGANFTVTSGSNIVTCTTCKFQTSTFHPAAVGDELFATNWTGSDVNYVASVAVIGLGASAPVTITSVDSDTQVHISANAGGNAGTTNGNAGVLAWGPDDTAANHAAKVAANDGINCMSVQISGPFTNMDTPDFNTAACRGVSGGSSASQYTGIYGANPSGNTTIILTPWFGLGSLAGCNASTSGIACFGGRGGFFNITFNGLGQSSFALTGHNLLENANDVSWVNLYCWGFAANSPGTIGMALNTGIHIVSNVISDGCGRVPVQVNGQVHPVFSLEALNGTPVGVGTINVSTGAFLSCFNCNVQPSVTSGIGIGAGSGAVYDGYGDSIFNLPYAGNCWAALSGTIHIDGGTCPNNGSGATAAATVITNTGTGVATIRNSVVAGGTSSGAFVMPSGGTLIYETGNKITANNFGTIPTVTGTLWGTGPTVNACGGVSTVEGGCVSVTEGTAPPANGTVILTFNQTYTLSAQPPSCSVQFGNGTGTWTAPVTAVISSKSSTAYTWQVTPGAALTNGSTYTMDWQCRIR